MASPYRMRWGDAWRSLQKLDRDPDDTAAVFEIIAALTGKSGERQFRRFARTATGRDVLAREGELLDRLRDRTTLESLPEGSLGREYAAFTARENLSADGLVDASEEGMPDRGEELDADRRRFFDYLRDSHDLQHVVTGYGRDLRGELALLAFGLQQGWHHGVGLIVGWAYLWSSRDERRLVHAAWRRARRARWLDGADWEALLAMPLERVREELAVGPPPEYEPVWSSAAPAAS